jgi:hypothetical protein
LISGLSFEDRGAHGGRPDPFGAHGQDPVAPISVRILEVERRDREHLSLVRNGVSAKLAGGTRLAAAAASRARPSHEEDVHLIRRHRVWLIAILGIALVMAALSISCSEGAHAFGAGPMDGVCITMAHTTLAGALGAASSSAPVLAPFASVIGVLLAFIFLTQAASSLALAGSHRDSPPDPLNGRLRI